VPRHWDARQRALVVLSLEAEVALDHDDDLAVLEHGNVAQAGDVPLDEGELLLGFLCVRVSGHALQRKKKLKGHMAYLAAAKHVDAQNL